jgi:alpha-1,2-mannosyltransferase
MAQPPITRTAGHSRWLPGFVLVALVVAFIARTRVETGQLTTTDLEVFWVSGKAVLAGRDPYLFWLPGAHLSLVYPPFTGLVLAPLSLLSLSALRIVWFTGVLVALQAIVWLATGWVGLRNTRIRLLLCPLAALAVFLIDPLWQELWSGQVNVFLALLVLTDLCRRDGARGRGIAIGLAAGIKLTPALFIVYLALTRRFREALTALITFATTVGAGFLVMPGQAWRYWTHYAWDVQRIYAQPGIVFNQSLRGAVARLLHHDAVLPWALTIAVVVVAGLAVCVGLYRRGLDREGAVLCGVVALLVSPVSWVYHWVWLVPVLIVLVAGAVRTRSPGWITATVVTAAVAVTHPYTWIGGFNATPSGLFLGYRGWWPSWTGFTMSPSGLVQQLAGDSLVLLGLLLLAGGAVLALSRPQVEAPVPVERATVR